MRVICLRDDADLMVVKGNTNWWYNGTCGKVMPWIGRWGRINPKIWWNTRHGEVKVEKSKDEVEKSKVEKSKDETR